MKVVLCALFGVLAVSGVGAAQVWVDPCGRPDGTERPRDCAIDRNGTMRDNYYGLPESYSANAGQITPGDPYRIDRKIDRTPVDPRTAPRNPYGNPVENPFGNPVPR